MAKTEMSSETCQLFGAAFASLRRDYGYSTWNERGTSTALWHRREQDAAQTVRAMAKAAATAGNEAPTSVNFTSSQDSMPNACREHPLSGIRQDGACAGCWSERVGSDEPLPLQPKSTRSDEDRARIRDLARGVKS